MGSAGRAPQALQARLAAQRALLEGDAPTAAAQWRTRLQATPADTEAELNLARALGAGGDFDGALKVLQALTTRDAGDPRAWFELGKLSLADLAALGAKNGEPKQTSGKQERYENLLNQYLLR